MIINVSIVEDEKEHRIYLEDLLRQWQELNCTPVRISSFGSAEDFSQAQIADQDAVFLDIQLKDHTGIELAQTLRQDGYHGELIFLTAYQEYVFEGYNVHALNYFLKPVTGAQLDSCMQYILRKTSASCLICRHYGDIIRIPYQEIRCLTSSNQYTEIHTSGGIHRQAGPLKNMISRLPVQFVQCHRTAVVNIDHVEKLQGSAIFLDNGDSLPISRTYLNDVRRLFLKLMEGSPIK